MFELARIFRSGMVLQRDKQIAVWGNATPSRMVSVSIQGQSGSAIADDSGFWKIMIDPLRTSENETMTVVCDESVITLTDVAIGEVWFCGGQSNMEFHMMFDADFDEEKSVCTDPLLRFFDYPEVSYPEQLNEADYWAHYGFWRKAEPRQLRRFSAVAYYFAKRIRREINVPVGLIGCNWGGTPICTWMSRQAVLDNGGSIYIEEYEKALEGLDLEEYEERFRKDPNSQRADQLADPVMNEMMFGATIPQLMEKMAKRGIEIPAPETWGPVIGPKWNCRPGGLYESMVLPLAPYGLRGFLWYQGETDGDMHPEPYKQLFSALIRQWRELWGETMPFLFVQAEPLERWMDSVGESCIPIRAAQQTVADTVGNVGMAVITDAGMRYDIHPKKKQPVGERLALLALNKVYGQTDLLCEAPRPAELTVKDGALILRFSDAGDGLYLSDTTPYKEPAPKTCAGWLRVFCNGSELDGNTLIPTAQGDSLILRSAEILSEGSYRAELALTGWYQVPLYNSAGIPARPGRIETI